ncbi:MULTISPECIES: TetR/AcrR family transcriptional regulator [unclassified Lysinibacillus]|uniref:TetR/AcrR family transcriptional regulator n=1 Tax=unclassified Lysinibacillus TaxID=2636778 RepID=UPI002013BF02|nr:MULTISPECIES: TetR/AcrR family transcriptional regulator [unclassified Lysinibacillus]MCL1697360.1 TetR/AcrR family transcriptional regulator [Lysinibacillus sp. BPa_S21]MCL1702179.1 TetR/AcrR family transcriptional regulator [Lysinibacillus sp. Bpr_S20]
MKNCSQIKQDRARETRNTLIEAGKRVFFEQGFQKSTMKQIIKEAGVGHGTAYVYFSNKDALLIEIIDSLLEKMYNIAMLSFVPKSKEEAREQIIYQVKAFNKQGIENEKLMRLVLEAIGVSEEVREKWSLVQQHFIDHIEKDILYVQNNNIAKHHLNAKDVAHMWYHINENLLWRCLQDPNVSIEQNVDLIVHFYIEGLYTD